MAAGLAQMVGLEMVSGREAGIPVGLQAGAPAWLRRPGAVVVEIAPHQAGIAVELAEAAGFDEVVVRPDLAGRARALVGRVVGA